jgi:thiamine biosynthesis protein ThiS
VSRPIAIRVNGAAREVPAGTTVARLTELLGLVPARIAVERNGALVRRAEHAATELRDGDALEIVTLVGGG